MTKEEIYNKLSQVLIGILLVRGQYPNTDENTKDIRDMLDRAGELIIDIREKVKEAK